MGSSTLFAQDEPADVVLADLPGLTLTVAADGTRTASIASIDTSVRTSHVPTTTVTDLLTAAVDGSAASGGGASPDAGGPRLQPTCGWDGDTATVTVVGDLLEGTLTEGITVQSFDASAGTPQWAPLSFTASFDQPSQTLTIDTNASAVLAAGDWVRIVVWGTGATPVMGPGAAPTDPPVPLAGHGRGTAGLGGSGPRRRLHPPEERVMTISDIQVGSVDGPVVLTGTAAGYAVVPVPTPLTFLNYYDGKFLRASDLDQEQLAQRALVRLSNVAGGAGVVSGFDVSLGSNDTLGVSAGLAVAPTGDVLYLPQSISVSVSDLLAAMTAPATDVANGPSPGAGAGSFAPCAPASPVVTVAPTMGSDLYLITVGLIEGLCGTDEVFGRLCDAACTTATDRPWRIDGVVIGLVPLSLVSPLESSTAVPLGLIHLRSRVASAYFADEEANAGSLISGLGPALLDLVRRGHRAERLDPGVGRPGPVRDHELVRGRVDGAARAHRDHPQAVLGRPHGHAALGRPAGPDPAVPVPAARRAGQRAQPRHRARPLRQGRRPAGSVHRPDRAHHRREAGADTDPPHPRPRHRRRLPPRPRRQRRCPRPRPRPRRRSPRRRSSAKKAPAKKAPAKKAPAKKAPAKKAAAAKKAAGQEGRGQEGGRPRRQRPRRRPAKRRRPVRAAASNPRVSATVEPPAAGADAELIISDVLAEAIRKYRRNVADVIAGEAAASDRILIDGGIVELPPAGYLPVDLTGVVDVPTQVQRLLGPGLDLRFCTMRHDQAGFEVRKAQDLDRISMLVGIDDPTAKPQVDILVPDATWSTATPTPTPAPSPSPSPTPSPHMGATEGRSPWVVPHPFRPTPNTPTGPTLVPTLDWVLFRRRSDLDCGSTTVVTPPVVATVWDIQVPSEQLAVRDWAVLIREPDAIPKMRWRQVGQASFTAGTADLLTTAAQIADWDTADVGPHLSGAGYAASTGTDPQGIARAKAVADALGLSPFKGSTANFADFPAQAPPAGSDADIYLITYPEPAPTVCFDVWILDFGQAEQYNEAIAKGDPTAATDLQNSITPIHIDVIDGTPDPSQLATVSLPQYFTAFGWAQQSWAAQGTNLADSARWMQAVTGVQVQPVNFDPVASCPARLWILPNPG